jgi:hypothetical protein
MQRSTLSLVVLTLALYLSDARAQTLEQSQQLTAAAKNWANLGATHYRYRLRVGGVFGGGEYKVEVKDNSCKSRHVGGIGFGKAHFFEHFRTEPTCDQRLIADLLNQVQVDVARGYTIDDIEVDATYGFLKKAHLDTEQLYDQGWGFEVSEFRVLAAKRKPPN